MTTLNQLTGACSPVIFCLLQRNATCSIHSFIYSFLVVLSLMLQTAGYSFFYLFLRFLASPTLDIAAVLFQFSIITLWRRALLRCDIMCSNVPLSCLQMFFTTHSTIRRAQGDGELLLQRASCRVTKRAFCLLKIAVQIPFHTAAAVNKCREGGVVACIWYYFVLHNRGRGR